MEEARAIVERAVARSELPASTDPALLFELVFGPAVLRTLLLVLDVDAASAGEIVARAEAALRPATPPGAKSLNREKAIPEEGLS